MAHSVATSQEESKHGDAADDSEENKEMMKLIKFKVTNFRSVDDSGWIEVDKVAALIGTNESGKTNLLLPLWKLKPAKDGAINPTADYPRKRFNEIRTMPDEEKPVFIETHFELSDALAEQIAEITTSLPKDVKYASVERTLGGKYRIGFPEAPGHRFASQAEVAQILSEAQSEIADMAASKTEEALKVEMLEAIAGALSQTSNNASSLLTIFALKKINDVLKVVDVDNVSKRSTISPRFGQALDALAEMYADISKPTPSQSQEARNLVLKNLPSFVYYSNYGNLDSEIYLPHVIQNMERSSLGSREEAKARTLKVLFEFVKLKPQEILELGQELPASQGGPTDEEIKVTAEKKKERDILLQSAGTELTQKFRSWWKQGDYRFRFQADGDHFRIWVSDDKRPEDIELEGRSTGLQWFLSFYLIFLVESADSHEDAILLLDEPGLSLHPLAQRDLSEFFENLARSNQLLYTTHSPFLVDPDHLDRVKAVYVNDDGTTAVSSNLRAGESNSAQSRSIYPVLAAVGLSVSDTLLQGCRSVVVEGPSDQHYLSGIKNYLIGRGIITPKREFIFVPAGGVRGVGAVVAILAGKDEVLPPVVLDSDASGQGLAKQLTSGLYAGASEQIIMMETISGLAQAEIEDLFPPAFLAKVVNRFLRGPEEDFSDVVEAGRPIVPQIQQYAEANGLKLEPGWKVEIAMQAKARLLKEADPLKNDAETVERWKTLFLQMEL